MQYRKNVGIVILNKNDKIFVGKRSDAASANTVSNRQEAWNMPQGGIDENEDIEVAMFRELYEETGLNRENISIIKKADKTIKYIFPDEIRRSMPQGMSCYIGQEQVWFLVRLIANDNMININIEQKPEFIEWKWSDVNFIIDNCIYFKKAVYKEVFQMFKLI